VRVAGISGRSRWRSSAHVRWRCSRTWRKAAGRPRGLGPTSATNERPSRSPGPVRICLRGVPRASVDRLALGPAPGPFAALDSRERLRLGPLMLGPSSLKSESPHHVSLGGDSARTHARKEASSGRLRRRGHRQRRRQEVDLGRRRCAAAATASRARANAKKNESPCISISTPACSPKESRTIRR